MWSVVFPKRMMTLVAEKELFLVVGAFGVFNIIICLTKMLWEQNDDCYPSSIVCNESFHFRFGEK